MYERTPARGPIDRRPSLSNLSLIQGMCRGRSRPLVPEGTERGASPEQSDPRHAGDATLPMVSRGAVGELDVHRAPASFI